MSKKDSRYRLPDTATPKDTIHYSPHEQEPPATASAKAPMSATTQVFGPLPQLRNPSPSVTMRSTTQSPIRDIGASSSPDAVGTSRANLDKHGTLKSPISPSKSQQDKSVHFHVDPFASSNASAMSPSTHVDIYNEDDSESDYSEAVVTMGGQPMGIDDWSRSLERRVPTALGKRLVRKLVRVKRRGKAEGILVSNDRPEEELKPIVSRPTAEVEASPTSTTKLLLQPRFLVATPLSSATATPRRLGDGRPPSGRKATRLDSSGSHTPDNTVVVNHNNVSQSISTAPHTPNSISLDFPITASGDSWALRNRSRKGSYNLSATHLTAGNVPSAISGTTPNSVRQPTPKDSNLPSASAPSSFVQPSGNLQRPPSSMNLLGIPRNPSNLSTSNQGSSMLGSQFRGGSFTMKSPSDRWQQLSSAQSTTDGNRIRRGRVLRGVAIPNAKPIRLSNYCSEDSSLVDSSDSDAGNSRRKAAAMATDPSRRPTTVEEGVQITFRQNTGKDDPDEPLPSTFRGKVIKFYKDNTKPPRHVKCFKDPKPKEKDIRKGIRQAIMYGLHAAMRPKKLFESIRDVCASSTSLFIFSRKNRVRCLCWHTVHSRVFELFIILHIFINSIVLATQDPSQTRATDNAADVYFTIVFFIEMVLRVIGEGFILHGGAYMRNGWNVLDFAIVLVSFLNLLPGMADLSALRPIRVLRPLRSMTAISGLRVMVIGLARSLMGLMNVLTLLLFIYSVFGVGGVLLWKGSYRLHCARMAHAFVNYEDYLASLPTQAANQTDWNWSSVPNDSTNFTTLFSEAINSTTTDGPNTTTVPTLPPGYFYAPLDDGADGSYCRPGNDPGTSIFGYGCPLGYSCQDTGNNYEGILNFDSVPQAFLLLFTVMTFEGWTSHLTNVYDAWGQFAFIYFFFFILFSSFFIPNLALAVINDKFVEVHDRILAQEERRLEQLDDKIMLKIANTIEFDPYQHVFAEPWVASPRWQPTLDMIYFWINSVSRRQDAVFRIIEGYDRPSSEAEALKIGIEDRAGGWYAYTLTLCIVLNTILLATYHHLQPDWLTQVQDWGSNIFTVIFVIDFLLRCLVCGPRLYFSNFFNVVDATSSVTSAIERFIPNTTAGVVFRAFRMLRLIKLLNYVESLRKILRVLVTSLKATGFLSIVVVLYIYMAALIGMQLFGLHWVNQDTTERAGFVTFFRSLVTVFQMLTFDEWDGIMVHAVGVTNGASFIYFVACILLGNYLIIQLFLAILIGAFEEDDITEMIIESEEKLLEAIGGGKAQVAEDGHADEGDEADQKGKKLTHAKFDPTATSLLARMPAQRLSHIGVELRKAKYIKANAVPELNTIDFIEINDGRHPVTSVVPAQGTTTIANPMEFAQKAGKYLLGSKKKNVQVEDVIYFRAPMAMNLMRAKHIAERKKELNEAVALIEAHQHSDHLGLQEEDSGSTGPPGLRSPHSIVVDYNSGNPLGSDEWAGPLDQPEVVVNISPRRSLIDDEPKSFTSGNSHQQHTLGTFLEERGHHRRGHHRGRSSVSTDHQSQLGAQVALLGSQFIAVQSGEYGLVNVDSHTSLSAETLAKLRNIDLTCKVCGQQMAIPLPTPPLIPFKTPAEVHERMCNAIQERIQKEKVLERLNDLIDHHVELGVVPRSAFVEDILGKAWSNGLLLWAKVEDLLPDVAARRRAINNPLTADQSMRATKLKRRLQAKDYWEGCYGAIRTERLALALRLNEEQVGGSFSSYTIRPMPISQERVGKGRTMLIFSADNSVRLLAQRFLSNRWFDLIMLACIFISSITLAVESPRYEPAQAFRDMMSTIDIIFTSIFTLEMVCKLLVFGVVGSPTSYFRDPFNWIDCFIVIVNIIALAATSVNVSFLRVLRVLRALRPLRLVTKNSGTRTVVLTLVMSGKRILNVLLFALLNYTLFAVMGTQLFAGRFYRCNDSGIVDRVACVGTFLDDVANETHSRHWYNSDRNFDNFPNALLALFEVSTMEYWTDVLWDSVDHVSYDSAPIADNNIAFAAYYLVFIIIASFVILNMFVAVVISSFNKVQAELGGAALLTPSQRMWSEAQRVLLNFKPTPLIQSGKTARSQWLHWIVKSKLAERFMFVCIIANAIILMMDHYDPPPDLAQFIITAGDVFTGVFVLEAMLKIAAYEWRYFYDSWNRLEFVIVVFAIFNTILRETVSDSLSAVSTLQMAKLFRVLRMFRLVKGFGGVKLLLEALWYSLPSIANVGGLMLMLMFLYSVMGVQLFYNIDTGSIIDGKYTNFFDFWNAFQLTFRFVTMTDWNEVMHDCMKTAPMCGAEYPSLGDCGLPGAPIYFISFVVLASLILMNLVVAIILDNFNTTTHIEKSQVQMRDIQRFIDVWSTLDPDASMTIPTSKFPVLLSQLRQPLGISRIGARLETLRMCGAFDIIDHGGKIHFFETLIPMARLALGLRGLDHRAIREQEQTWRAMMPDLARLPLLRVGSRGVLATVDLYFAAVFIQSAFRRRMARRVVYSMRRDATSFRRSVSTYSQSSPTSLSSKSQKWKYPWN